MNKKNKELSALGYFKYFKNLVGWHIYGYLILNFLIGFLDGLGLTMFIPLLSIASGSGTGQESLGKLEYFVKLIEKAGFGITLPSVLTFMISLFILKGIIYYIRILYFTNIRINALRKIRIDLLSGLSNVSFSSFTKMEAGHIQNTIVSNVGKVLSAMTAYFTSFQNIIMLVTYVSMAFVSNWKFAIMVGIGGLVTNILYSYIGKVIKKYSRKVLYLCDNFNGLLIQAIHNYKYLKATNTFGKYKKKLTDILYRNDDYDFKMTRISGIAESLREPMIVSIIAIVIILQVHIMGGNFGSILVSLLLFYRSLGHLVSIQSSWNSFLGASAGLENVDGLLTKFKDAREPSHQNNINNISDIEVEKINIIYGKTPILKDISLNIKSKTSIALIGESGAGKTTLANVICGLLIPDQGKVLINNQSLYDSNLSSFRKKIGYITQEPVVFDDTLFNNITFWDEKTSENLEKFQKVIEMVSLSNFFNELEDKEDTRLGNNGILVSGGQKQRISIARELYKDVELLIMDEATSALDSETERHIKENIDMLHGKFTMVIIAHRLSTIKNVDKIFLMDKGHIMESGNYTELLAKSEKFKNMVKSQDLQ
ncbi:multidrug ABC transporter ATP-binding protein [Bergeyella porcorum]|uniref:Multidrug ABC transporter ATP-binding protein n=1 Tax=Bergeyella porcorum TaxID=1735111 RepID=A0AAU0F166_9FLAO